MRGPDAGTDLENIQVRTRSKSHYELIIHPDDLDGAKFFLVVPTIDPFTFNIVGWFYGRDGKDNKYWQDPAGGRPAYFIPQWALHDSLTPKEKPLPTPITMDLSKFAVTTI